MKDYSFKQNQIEKQPFSKLRPLFQTVYQYLKSFNLCSAIWEKI